MNSVRPQNINSSVEDDLPTDPELWDTETRPVETHADTNETKEGKQLKIWHGLVFVLVVCMVVALLLSGGGSEGTPS